MARITEIVPEPLVHVLMHLRDKDREEIAAVRGEISPGEIAIQLGKLSVLGQAWLFWDEDTGEPSACLGSYPMTPTCSGCWAFGTDRWDKVVATVTKHIHRIMIPALLKGGFHRAECRALASREDTRRWLTGLGWKAEAVLSGFGVRREDFTLFAWLADESANRFRQPPQQGELPFRDTGRRAGVDASL